MGVDEITGAINPGPSKKMRKTLFDLNCASGNPGTSDCVTGGSLGFVSGSLADMRSTENWGTHSSAMFPWKTSFVAFTVAHF